ncbi:hypothetical protein FRC02_009979 [Tulasnella sp. 418]|nr:hypothetical protein FRC02_009979 [Tulasnella sp. 418]
MPSKTTTSSSERMKEEKVVYYSLWDVELEGELEGCVPVYDDCSEIRRKIRVLQKTPGFKVSHWLKNIGNINSNSLRRFLNQSGPSTGAGNTIYYRAYIYFEKKRIFEGKTKSTKRIDNEHRYPNGFELKTRNYVRFVE